MSWKILQLQVPHRSPAQIPQKDNNIASQEQTTTIIQRKFPVPNGLGHTPKDTKLISLKAHPNAVGIGGADMWLISSVLFF